MSPISAASRSPVDVCWIRLVVWRCSDVLHLVGEDAGQLLRALRPFEQAAEHDQEPPGAASALTSGRFTTISRNV